MISPRDLKWLRACVSCAEIFSTCGKAQFWCFIVENSGYGRIIGQGYNGVPSGMKHCKDGGCPRWLNKVPPGTPYDYGDGLCYSSHAEVSALSHGDGSRYREATLYVNGPPCLTCAKSIAAAGISRIVCLMESGRLFTDVTEDFLAKAKVELEYVNDLN
jgi:deoxycytidylate deaminase